MMRWWSGALALMAGCAAISVGAQPPPGDDGVAAGGRATPAKPDPRPPSIAAFARLPLIEGPDLSPDGQRLAMRVVIGKRQQLAIFPISDAVHGASVTVGNYDVNGWEWVNDKWLILLVGANAPVEGGSYYIRRTLGISADGKKTVVLGKGTAAQRADDVLWVAHDGSPHILLALQTSIYAGERGLWPEVRNFDVSTGDSTVAAASTDQVSKWFADGNGTVRMGLSYDDATRSTRLYYRYLAGARFKTVAQVRGIGVRLGPLPALFLGDPTKAIAIDDADGYRAVYDFDLAGFKIGIRRFGVPGRDIETVFANSDQTALLGVQYTDTQQRTSWFDPSFASIQDDIDKSVGTRQARIASWNADRSVLVIHVGSADQPGAFYLYRPAEGVMHLIAWVNDAFAAAQSPVTTISYQARDGLQIEAVMTLPRGRSAKSLPLIIMPHGNVFARDAERWDWWAQFLASRGYAVVQPNFRGSSGYGTAFAKKGEGQLGRAMQDDLVDAVDWAVKKGIADPHRVCIIGSSYGGYAALRAAQRDHGVYRCAVSVGGVSSMPAMLRYDDQFLHSSLRKDWLRTQAPDLESVSPINFAKDFTIPVLIVHGKLNTVVPVRQSRDLVSRLSAANKSFRYVELPDRDHQLSREADRVQFLTELEAFLKAHNPA